MAFFGLYTHALKEKHSLNLNQILRSLPEIEAVSPPYRIAWKSFSLSPALSLSPFLPLSVFSLFLSLFFSLQFIKYIINAWSILLEILEDLIPMWWFLFLFILPHPYWSNSMFCLISLELNSVSYISRHPPKVYQRICIPPLFCIYLIIYMFLALFLVLINFTVGLY